MIDKPFSEATSRDIARDAHERAEKFTQERELADLKRKLSDSIAREQEIERELTDCHQQRCKLRAHADALAGALEDMAKELGMMAVKALQHDNDYLKATARQLHIEYRDGVPTAHSEALNAYRKSQEPGE